MSKTRQTPDREIARIAGCQHGYVTRRQLQSAGVTRGQIEARVRRGGLIRVHTGVYAVGHVPDSAVSRAAAAVLAGGPGAVLSHGSASSTTGARHWS
jgi:predicted transcriptional regulator of viral defense system